MNASAAYSDGTYSYTYASETPHSSSGPAQYLVILVSLVLMVTIVVMLHMFDNTDVKPLGKELISPFTGGKAGATLINWFLTYVFTVLWSFLFIIPGIVKSYAYSMSYYITDDWARQGYKVKNTEAINASKEMMKGHKWELFVLDLSFLGWYILSLITFGLASLYVTPYHYATRAAFYRHLAALQAQQAPQGQYGQPVAQQPVQPAQPSDPAQNPSAQDPTAQN